jgi:bifunctional pyridoxal-dependent enzyme with beta-cystathionase and maltose regulon repressor activities
MDEEKLIILVQGHECLYNLQHDYDNNLVKDNCWKEIAGEWQGSGKVVAGSSGERHMNGMVCVDRPLTRQGNGMVCVNRPLLAYFHIQVQQNGHTYAECNVYETEYRWSGQDIKEQRCIM